MQWGARVAAAAVAVVLLAVPTPPAEAAAGSGVAHVSCEADFPHVPALVWTDGGTCDGTATVEGAGVDDAGDSFTLGGGGDFLAEFRYYEPCFVDGQPAIFLSFADGTFTISGLQATRPAGLTPWLLSATVTGDFTWSRVGTNPFITVENVVVSLSDGAVSTGPGLRGLGTATLVPPGSFDSSKHLLCGQSGGPLTIRVEIAAALAV